MKAPLIMFLIAFSIVANAQDPEGMLGRLQGYKENTNFYFNSDGIEIECFPKAGVFTSDNVAMTYKFARLKPKKLKADPGLNRKNFYEPGEIYRSPNLTSTLNYYFVENGDSIVAFTFTSNHEISQDFERAFINLFLDHKIPNDIYQPADLKSINFIGRMISPLPWNCEWAGATDLRCPGGQVKWSAYKSEAMAQAESKNHLKYIEAEGNSISLKETINVTFEGNEVKAMRFRMSPPDKRVGSFSVHQNPMTAYLMVAEVRGRYVTCVIIRSSESGMLNLITDN